MFDQLLIPIIQNKLNLSSPVHFLGNNRPRTEVPCVFFWSSLYLDVFGADRRDWSLVQPGIHWESHKVLQERLLQVGPGLKTKKYWNKHSDNLLQTSCIFFMGFILNMLLTSIFHLPLFDQQEDILSFLFIKLCPRFCSMNRKIFLCKKIEQTIL